MTGGGAQADHTGLSPAAFIAQGPANLAALTADHPASVAIAALREVAFWRERAGADTHRVQAYRRAAEQVEELPSAQVAELGTSAARWTRLPGIGPATGKVVAAALAGDVPAAVAQARAEAAELLDADDPGFALALELQGDLHAHSRASDGSTSIAEMAAVAQALGRSYQAITDHSPRLRVANGLSPERLRAQLAEIAELNAGYGNSFRILTGIEVDILEDGSLDQSDELLAQVDVVVASVHSDLRAASNVMTRRMVTAVSNPHVDVLGHCTGQLVAGPRAPRPRSKFDADAVFEACREHGTAVEISSRPERRDPPADLLELAVAKGCLFAIDSDAHAPGQLAWLPWAASRAAAAGVPARDIVTTWPLADLLAWTRG